MIISKELKAFAKDLTLLIVEDDVSLNEELCFLTKLFFREVKSAHNGVQALEIYKESPSDIILTDITMPHMDGVELCKKIKAINDDQDIIVLSAHSEIEYFVELIDIGIRQFVHKPFKDEEFLYRMLKVCEQISLSRFYDDGAIAQKIPLASVEIKEEVQVLGVKKSTISVLSKKQLSSEDFLQDLQKDSSTWNLISEDISIMIEISEDFEQYVNEIYLGKLSKKLLLNMAILLKKMHGILYQIEVLRSMGAVLFDLASFLEELDFDSLSNEQKEKFKVLEFIYDDISRFVQTVFIYKDTIDVHYLKDSLKSSVEQLKDITLDGDIEEEDLELF